MPLYEYQCDACGQRFEVIQKFSDPPAATCTKCGKGPVTRLFSSPAIQFKGSGWYITDYAKKTPDATGAKPAADRAKSETKSESKSDSKSESSSSTTDSSTKSESSKPAASTKE
jgi:putative FmdB family regulatory protein